MKLAEVQRRNRYRGLRGLVRHVKLPLAGKSVNWMHRSPAAGIAHRGVWGTCTWCGLTAISAKTGRKLKWHNSCAFYYRLAAGQHSSERDFALRRTKPAVCKCGRGEPSEVDHILSIGVAARLSQTLGTKVYVLAFLPENLQWICHRCHSAKTRFDRAWMRLLDGLVEEKPKPKEPEPSPQLSMTLVS